MGFLTPTPPPVEPAELLSRPLMERMRFLATHWVDHGFGSPRVFHVVYILRLILFYAFGGVLVATLTSDVGGVFDVSAWWDEPIVYEKAVLWTVLLEILGLGGSWGPLAGHFKPMTGGCRYWLKPGTIRMPPWGSRIPGTGGDTRTVGDVALYAAVVVSLVVALVLPGVGEASLTAADPDASGGLVRPGALLTIAVLLVLLGLRDKVVFLAARSEQYLPVILIPVIFDEFVDMVIAFKLVIVVVWLGAGFSKLGDHFIHVVAPMISNSPLVPGTWIRRKHYRNPPEDLRPGRLAYVLAHGGGTAVELIVPLVLLFATNAGVAVAAACFMVFFHVFIISTFPLAVPLEWNVLFGYTTVFLFVGFPAGDGYGVTDFSEPWMLPVVAAALLLFPVWGNLRPDQICFLPSMRQYAGNWASAIWAFAPGCEARLNELDKPARNQVDQLQEFGFDAAAAEMTMQQIIAWRTMHSQGRGLFSLLFRHLDDVERYTIREAEFAFNSVYGFNFGCAHFHDERLIAAIQRRLNFAPGEFLVMWVESQPVHRSTQAYQVIDAALGVVERGTWNVADAVREQPWLPNGPIPLTVTWTAPGYTPASVAKARV